MRIALLLVALNACATTSREAMSTATPTSTPPVTETTRVDRHAIAKQLVDTIARVRPGERVLILGEPRFTRLMEELWLVVRSRGGHPLIQLEGPDLFERYFEEVPAEHDGEAPAWELALAELADVLIKVAPHHPELLRQTPADRLANVTAAREPAEERKIARKVRQVLVGNGLLPTAGMAETHDLSAEELARIFWASMAVEPDVLRARGQPVTTALAAGRLLRITHENGTDLTMEIQGRPAFLSVGVIAPEDLERGASGIVFVPAGEVWVTPVPGTTTGTVRIPSLHTAAGDIQELTLSVEEGRVVTIDATASEAFDVWRAQYDDAPAGKEQLSWFDVGLNPAVRGPGGKPLLNFIASGMVTLGLGKNTWAGGDNAVPYGVYLFLPGATVTVDDEAIVRAGELP